MAGRNDQEIEGEFQEGEEGEGAPKEATLDVEMLCLIEFLVETMKLDFKNLDFKNIDPCQLQGQTCLQLDFLNFPTMNICEQDLDACRQTGAEEIMFNSGKSLMFAVPNQSFDQSPPIFLKIGANKMMPHGVTPDKLMLGSSKICLSDLFKHVFEKVEDDPKKVPVAKSIKDTYHLISDNQQVVGEFELYMRLTCLGQNVVTEFQRGDQEDDPVLYKNKQSDQVYECKPRDDVFVGTGNDLCPPCPGYGRSTNKNQTKGFGKPVPSIFNDGDYEEFGCEVNGHALTVRVQKSDKKRSKKANRLNLDEFCDCDIPLPDQMPSAAKRNGPGDIPPGGVGTNGNQIIFQVPPNQDMCKKADNGVVYNVSTCEDGPAHGHTGRSKFKIAPDSIEEPSNAKLPNDPDKDVFVLRIGKKGQTADGKGKLELELRTPKQKIEEPPRGPYMVDREIQTEGGEKKGKGKKGKK